MNHDIYNLKELSNILSKKLKENSIAEVTFDEGFFGDKIIVDHDPEKAGGVDHEIIITKSSGEYALRYYEDGELIAILEIDANWSDAVSEIIHFVNNHTMHDSSSSEEQEEEIITIDADKDNGEWVIVDNNGELAYGESFSTEDLAGNVLEELRVGAKGTDHEDKYDGYNTITKADLAEEEEEEEQLEENNS